MTDLVRDAVEVLAERPRRIALAELDIAVHRERIPVACPRDDLEAPIGIAKVPRDASAQISFPDVQDTLDRSVDGGRPEARVIRGDLVEVTMLVGDGGVQDPAGVRRHPTGHRVWALVACIDDVHALVRRADPNASRCRIDVNDDRSSEAAQELWLWVDEEARARLPVTGIQKQVAAERLDRHPANRAPGHRAGDMDTATGSRRSKPEKRSRTTKTTQRSTAAEASRFDTGTNLR
jgi:hypothetical protein